MEEEEVVVAGTDVEGVDAEDAAGVTSDEGVGK